MLETAALIYNKRCATFEALLRSADSFKLSIIVKGSRALWKRESSGCGCVAVVGCARLWRCGIQKPFYGLSNVYRNPWLIMSG